MATNKIPPSPLGQDIRHWALQLTEFLRDTGAATSNAPVAVHLEHFVAGRTASAKGKGVVMYDGVQLVPAVSNGVEWERLALAPLLQNTPEADTLRQAPTSQTVAKLTRVLLEVLDRLDALERRT